MSAGVPGDGQKRLRASQSQALGQSGPGGPGDHRLTAPQVPTSEAIWQGPPRKSILGRVKGGCIAKEGYSGASLRGLGQDD